MAELVLFHHAQGLTPGARAFADDLRADGHVVHTPDLYEGRTFATLDEGVAHAQEIGFGTVLARGRADDTEEVIRNRLEVYRDKTAPLIDFYAAKGLLISVEAQGSVDAISERLETALS